MRSGRIWQIGFTVAASAPDVKHTGLNRSFLTKLRFNLKKKIDLHMKEDTNFWHSHVSVLWQHKLLKLSSCKQIGYNSIKMTYFVCKAGKRIV